MRLTVEQQEVLNKSARLNGCDTWFVVMDGYCYDLEKNKKRSTKNMVSLLCDGGLPFATLTRTERIVLRNLLINLGIVIPEDEEYINANPVMIKL